MKIAMPVDSNSMESNVATSFGRSNYFLIYDTVSEKVDFLINDAVDCQGGAGIKAAQSVLDKDVSSVLVPRCGENAAKVFQNSKIMIYQTKGSSIKENIAAFMKNELSLLQEIQAGHHHEK